jgi:hypothetical protein
MSIFKRIGKFAGAVACKTGFHDHEDHPDPTHPCRTIRICRRAPDDRSHDEAVIVHPWSEWTTTATPCRFTRACGNKCGEPDELKTEHRWPSTWSGTEDPCVLVKRCERDCGVEPRTQTSHHYPDAWQYWRVDEAQSLLPDRVRNAVEMIWHRLHEPDVCIRYRLCEHFGGSCVGFDLDLTSHDWEEPVPIDDPTSCRRRWRCQKCQHSVERPARRWEHSFGEAPAGSIATCTRCGES